VLRSLSVLQFCNVIDFPPPGSISSLNGSLDCVKLLPPPPASSQVVEGTDSEPLTVRSERRKSLGLYGETLLIDDELSYGLRVFDEFAFSKSLSRRVSLAFHPSPVRGSFDGSLDFYPQEGPFFISVGGGVGVSRVEETQQITIPVQGENGPTFVVGQATEVVGESYGFLSAMVGWSQARVRETDWGLRVEGGLRFTSTGAVGPEVRVGIEHRYRPL